MRMLWVIRHVCFLMHLWLSCSYNFIFRTSFQKTYKNTSGMSWLRPKGTVSNFDVPRVTMWALSCVQLNVFLSSGFELVDASSATREQFVLSLSFLSLKEFDLKFGDPFSGVEFRVVSLRKLISELHSSKWKLFLKTNTLSQP